MPWRSRSKIFTEQSTNVANELAVLWEAGREYARAADCFLNSRLISLPLKARAKLCKGDKRYDLSQTLADVSIPELALTQFILQHAASRAYKPALINSSTVITDPQTTQ